jgi:hypothetical protein
VEALWRPYADAARGRLDRADCGCVLGVDVVAQPLVGCQRALFAEGNSDHAWSIEEIVRLL